MLFRWWKHEFCMRPVPPARTWMAAGIFLRCSIHSQLMGASAAPLMAKAIMQGVSQHRVVPKAGSCPPKKPSPLAERVKPLPWQKGSKRTPQTGCVLSPAAAQPPPTEVQCGSGGKLSPESPKNRDKSPFLLTKEPSTALSALQTELCLPSS